MCGCGKQRKIENGEVYFPRRELYGTLISLGIALLNLFGNSNCDFHKIGSWINNISILWRKEINILIIGSMYSLKTRKCQRKYNIQLLKGDAYFIEIVSHFKSETLLS